MVLAVLAFNGTMYSLYLVGEMMIRIEGISQKILCIFRILPVGMFIIFLYLVDSQDTFCINNGALIFIAGGLIFTICTTKLIVSTMAKMPFNGFQVETLIFGLFFYVQYCTGGKSYAMNKKYSFLF